MTPDIYHTELSRGLALAWVNSYSAVVVKTPGATLLFDPVSLVVPEDTALDLIAISHDHSDHWDPQLVAELQLRARAMAVSPHLAARLAATIAPVGNSPSPSASSTPSTSTGEGWDGGAPPASVNVHPMLPGDRLEVGDVELTALRCDHAAREPLSFMVRTSDGLTVYLPGDSTPFPEMAELPTNPHPKSLSLGEKDGSDAIGARVRVDVLLWMGTVLGDGAEILRLVAPKALATYAIAPPAAGIRSREMLTRLAPEVSFHALERNQVFMYSASGGASGVVLS